MRLLVLFSLNFVNLYSVKNTLYNGYSKNYDVCVTHKNSGGYVANQETEVESHNSFFNPKDSTALHPVLLPNLYSSGQLVYSNTGR